MNGFHLNAKYKRMVMFVLGIAYMFLSTFLFYYVWKRFYGPFITRPFYISSNWIVVFVYIVVLFGLNKLYGGLKIGTLRIIEIIYSQGLALFITNFLAYLQICLIAHNLMWFPPMLVLVISQFSLSIVWAYFSNLIYFRVFPPRKMLLIYGTNQGYRLLAKLKTRSDKYMICGKISAQEPLVDILTEIQDYTAVVLCDVKSSVRNSILKFCYNNNIRTYLTPKISDIIVSNAFKMHIFDTPLFLCSNKGFSMEQRFVKRTLDLVICIILTVLALPFMLITAVAIKLQDGGPVIFSQERLTRNGKIFKLYKFRSMVIDAEKDGVARLSTKHDSRITPVGKVIRKIRFDELPQLFNILKGDMSFIGPRPERPEIAKEYKTDMPEFDFRLKVKAGLTGFAQVLGKYNTVPYDKLKLDLMYIESYSILLDLKLVLMTIKTLFLNESTEGIADNSENALQSKILQENNLPEDLTEFQ